MQYVTEVFDRAGRLDRLAGFCAEFGRAFYRVETSAEEGNIEMIRRVVKVKDVIGGPDGIVPFRAGETLEWDVIWK